MIDDEQPSEEGVNDTEDEASAAESHSGQEQQPKQAEEESSGLWDTKQHSDAPGPFGTGDRWEPEDQKDD